MANRLSPSSSVAVSYFCIILICGFGLITSFIVYGSQLIEFVKASIEASQNDQKQKAVRSVCYQLVVVFNKT